MVSNRDMVAVSNLHLVETGSSSMGYYACLDHACKCFPLPKGIFNSNSKVG